MQYIALIHKEPTSDYGVSFPDFPGCVSAGKSLDEAREMAEVALSLHIEGMIEDSQPLPSPSTLEAVMQDASYRQAVAFLVEAKVTERSIRINVSIPESDLRQIDAYAKDHGLTRSGLFLKATKQAINENWF